MKGETRTSRSIDRSTDEIARRARDSIFAPRDSFRATRFDPAPFFFLSSLRGLRTARRGDFFFSSKSSFSEENVNVTFSSRSKRVIFFEKSDRFNV